LISSQFLQDVHIVIAFSVVLVIIIINVLFDIIGTAVTAADEAPFHAMASRKLYGARESIRLIRNADKVSNFCNDVVGDICGVISGTASMFIIITFIGKGNNADTTLMGLAITGMVAAFTVGGKAFGKSIAIENSNYIIYKVGVVLKFLFGKLMFFKGKKKKNRQKTSKSNGN
jgi:Mg2+/Co2+ transporter CorB